MTFFGMELVDRALMLSPLPYPEAPDHSDCGNQAELEKGSQQIIKTTAPLVAIYELEEGGYLIHWHGNCSECIEDEVMQWDSG